MKKLIGIVLAVAMVLTLAGTALANPEGTPDANRIYKFNIIGVPKGKTADMTGDNGARIFVNLTKPSPIWLVEGEDFEILDANGTDADGSTLQMPPPGYEPYVLPSDGPVWSDYSIYIRSLGKPGGWATITTCADLLDSNFAGLLSGTFVSVLNRDGIFGGYASVEQVGRDITERPKGKSIFTNVTAALTSIVFKVEVEVLADYDVDGDGDGDVDDTEIIIEYVRVPIFSDILENEYWEYDNHGLKLLQVWIYDNATDVTLGDNDILNP